MAKLLTFPTNRDFRRREGNASSSRLLAARKAPMLFCNTGWMARYEGLKRQPDKIVGGGKYVDLNGHGAEVCNFLPTASGFVYGYVETIKRAADRRINLAPLGTSEDRAKGVTVVWTASHPDEGGRRIVGWYRNATVFRDRQEFDEYPSRQHRRDGIDSFRIRARSSDAWLLPVEDRVLRMGKGKGWMGWTPWWVPPASPDAEVAVFLQELSALLDGWSDDGDGAPLSITEKGRLRLHRLRERDPNVARLAKRHHGLTCQACGFDFRRFYGPLGRGFIEAHHLCPLALLKEGETKTFNVADSFAVLCSNCHRMVHRTEDPSNLAAFRSLLAIVSDDDEAV